jgi:hypothetical protein
VLLIPPWQSGKTAMKQYFHFEKGVLAPRVNPNNGQSAKMQQQDTLNALRIFHSLAAFGLAKPQQDKQYDKQDQKRLANGIFLKRSKYLVVASSQTARCLG